MKNARNLMILSMMLTASALLLPNVAGAAAKIGVVDVDKVSEGSTYFKAELAALDSFSQEKQTSVQQQLTSLAYNLLLSPQELDTYRQLLSESQPTPEKQKQVQDLEALDASRRQKLQELMRLQATPSSQLTEEQKASLSELNPLYQAAAQRRTDAEGLFDDAQKEIGDRETEVGDKLREELTDAIESVAKGRKLEVVLQKSLTIPLGQSSQEILFCLYVDPGSDMTDVVIKAIDQAHAPSAEEVPEAP